MFCKQIQQAGPLHSLWEMFIWHLIFKWLQPYSAYQTNCKKYTSLGLHLWCSIITHVNNTSVPHVKTLGFQVLGVL